MKVASILVFGSAVASQLVAAHTGSATAALRKHRRDLLKTLYARQDYPVQTTPPACEPGYDGTRQADGSCGCGAGREKDPAGSGQCVTPIVQAEYNTAVLTEPVTPPFAVTTTMKYTGNTVFMNANQCAAIAQSLQSAGSRGFYLQASATIGENDCWVIGDATSDPTLFFDPTLTGVPFTPAGASRTKRQNTGAQNGAIGAPGGTIGFGGANNPGTPGAGSCDATLGDRPQPNGSCICAADRVSANPPEDTLCKFRPSAGLTRRRLAVNNASW